MFTVRSSSKRQFLRRQVHPPRILRQASWRIGATGISKTVPQGPLAETPSDLIFLGFFWYFVEVKPSKPSRRAPQKETQSEPVVVSVEAEVLDPVDSTEGEPVAEVEVLPVEDEIEKFDAASEVIEVNDGEPVSIEPEPASSGLIRYDALSAYLREIGRIPQLSREEERDLAVRYYEHKDLEAAYKLVSSTLWLVVKIARDYERAARNLLDLVQEGNVGLLEAVKNFDPYRGVRFPSYAVWWIKAYIIRYVIANWRVVKLGTTQAQRKLFFNLVKEKERLEREGYYPGPKLLAEKLNVKESEVVEMEQRLGAPDMSVDAPLGEDGDSSLLSVLSDGRQSAETLFARKEWWQQFHDGLAEFEKTLNPKEIAILKQRMLNEEKATLQDMSDSLGISRERVRQIENRIREKLKNFLQERMGNEATESDFS